MERELNMSFKNVQIRVFRESKKWKLGVSFSGAKEKLLQIRLLPDKSIENIDKVSKLVSEALFGAIGKKENLNTEPIKEGFFGPISKRVIGVWPGEIEEGDRAWIVVEVGGNEKGEMLCSIANAFDKSMDSFVVDSTPEGIQHLTDKVLAMIKDLLKRPIKDPRQYEMFPPPETPVQNQSPE